MTATPPRRVTIETPWRTKDMTLRQRYRRYARAAIADSLTRGEAPFASHLLYTQPAGDGAAWDYDDDPATRERGLVAAMAWVDVAQAVIAYTDLGLTEGMMRAIARAQQAGTPVEYRTLADTHPELLIHPAARRLAAA